jgi:hypothetical protein
MRQPCRHEGERERERGERERDAQLPSFFFSTLDADEW